MVARRERGEGAISWNEQRQRFIVAITVGYTAAGKRTFRRASTKTKTEAKAALKKLLQEYEAGLDLDARAHTVGHAVEEWLKFGLNGRSSGTVDKNRYLAEGHLLPFLGQHRLRELRAKDVDLWLLDRAKHLSASSLAQTRSVLVRSINRAMAEDKVPRNVANLSQLPSAQPGRPSKALTLAQARSVLDASESSALHAYVVLSMLIGARTEELRALTWDHVHLEGRPGEPPSIEVWHSVRAHRDTKTRKSRRTLALPARCLVALRQLRGDRENPAGLVFCTVSGKALDAANVRRSFRAVVRKTDLDAGAWTPRELRHSFVSLLSGQGVAIETIADLCGHAGTKVTEEVYRKELRPLLLGGAEAMDRIFGDHPDGA